MITPLEENSLPAASRSSAWPTNAKNIDILTRPPTEMLGKSTLQPLTRTQKSEKIECRTRSLT